MALFLLQVCTLSRESPMRSGVQPRARVVMDVRSTQFSPKGAALHNAPSPLRAGVQPRARIVMEARSEEERRQLLAKLYPNEQLSPKDRPRANEPQPMSDDGVLAQPWGPLALVDVNGAEGPLTGVFRPLCAGGASRLLVLRMVMPLGLLLEETAPGRFEAVEVVEEGGAYGKVQPGDILRATTCVRMAMSYPAWQVVLGGVGRPTAQKLLLQLSPAGDQGAPADGGVGRAVPFEEMMAAIQSNAQNSPGGNGQIILLVERPASPDPRASTTS